MIIYVLVHLFVLVVLVFNLATLDLLLLYLRANDLCDCLEQLLSVLQQGLIR